MLNEVSKKTFIKKDTEGWKLIKEE